jgi:hypothetical protein
MPELADLPYVPYIDYQGLIPAFPPRQVGVFAIFDAEQNLQFVGYSRDIFISLKQHLVRQPQACQWVKIHLIDKPNRTILEEIVAAWTAGQSPPGNGEAAHDWQESIDCRYAMTAEETAKFPEMEEIAQSKLLKQVARRVEATIMEKLQARGLQTEIRFNPKTKERGLLDI